MADTPRDGLATGPDGRPRCWWSVGVPEYVAYHDQEWGRPVTDDTTLFERLVLESFQSGLSWLTILRKREAFRAAFAGFAVDVVAAYGPGDVDRLLGDAGIVRNRRKIEATIANARAVRGVIDEYGSYAAYLWSFAPEGGGAARRSAPRRPADLPAVTPESTALAADLKRRGFVFVGPTTVYAGMQAAGLVNDHFAGCCVREEVEAAHFETLARITGRA